MPQTLEGRLVGNADHFASKNGDLLCRRIILQNFEVLQGGRVQADTCGKTKMAPDWVPFLFWCG